jgi:hypothetical protein
MGLLFGQIMPLSPEHVQLQYGVDGLIDDSVDPPMIGDSVYDPTDLEEMPVKELEELVQEAQELGCPQQLQSLLDFMRAKGIQSSSIPTEPNDGLGSWLDEELSDGGSSY